MVLLIGGGVIFWAHFRSSQTCNGAFGFSLRRLQRKGIRKGMPDGQEKEGFSTPPAELIRKRLPGRGAGPRSNQKKEDRKLSPPAAMTPGLFL
jgi:hypothetical protein